MRNRIVVAAAFLTVVGAGSQVASACGDKFLLVGRGVTFRRAYAAIHPASILLVLPAKAVKSAAVRDSSLLTALKMAGHSVDVVQQPANLLEILGRSRHDIVIAERADVPDIAILAAPGGHAKPSIVAVVENASATDLTAARQQLDYVLKTPQSLPQILNMLDDVMKARVDGARRTTAPGA